MMSWGYWAGSAGKSTGRRKEDSGSVPITHTVTQTSATPVPEDPTPSTALCVYQASVWYLDKNIYVQTKHPYI